MKRIIGVILIIVSMYIVYEFLNKANSDFATSISLKYHYKSVAIDTLITDESDIRTMKELFRGNTHWDSPSCGFSNNISVTFTDGEKSIMFCPACDGDPIIRLYDSQRYIHITKEQRKQLDDILKKYGMVFPCI